VGAQTVAAGSAGPDVAVAAETAGKYCESFLDAYAAALGVERSALAPAATKAAQATIAAALAAGDITQAQADRLAARLKDAQVGGCPKFADRIGQARPAAGVVRDGVDAAAKALGMTTAELRAELKSGKDLKQIAAAKGVPYATVTAAALAPVKAKLDAAVAAGTIKQARADKILARLEANLADGRLRNGNPAPAASPAP
jgi:ribosomal protein S20